MRWPLRNQVLLPMTAVMLGAIMAVSVLNAVLAVRRTRWQIEGDVQGVGETLANSNFPLTDRVLEQMRGLAGAEFVLCDERGEVLASSMQPATPRLPTTSTMARGSVDFDHPVSLGDRRYFHALLPLRARQFVQPDAVLHALYPEDSYREAWRHAVYPPVIIGAAALVLVVLFGLTFASRVTRPVGNLRVQLTEIGHGNFRRIPVPERDDEIADLSRAINELAGTLARYEEEVRGNERLRTLGQLGSGIGHQLRNSVAGCRMAIELHSRECAQPDDSLVVARRQLELMDSYVRRFLRLGHSNAMPHVYVELSELLGGVVDLVAPTARHLGVALRWTPPPSQVGVLGDSQLLEELAVNLLLNAIEAASQIPAASPDSASRVERTLPEVRVTLQQDGDRVVFQFSDSGPGPSKEIEEGLFEAFVTDKPDGTGLGLSIAREIAAAHRGAIHWERKDGTTRFIVELPLCAE